MEVQLRRIGKSFFVAAIAALAPCAALAADIPLKAPAAAPIPFLYPDVPMFGDAIFADTPQNAVRGGFKIAEYESPRPTDRISFSYNYFNNVDLGVNTDVHRTTLAFEKTFLNGDASIGLRLPFIQIGKADTEIGDVSLVFKYALINNAATGNVLSTGLVITAPTSPISFGFDSIRNEQIHSAVFQPFIAGRVVFGDVFVQGFSSVAVPTDSRDVTYLFNDIGIGYVAYRGSGNDLIRAISPVAEIHVNTPIRNGQIGFPLPLDTIVNLTGGVQFDFLGGFQGRIGVAVPVTEPRPFRAELITQVNFRF